MQESQHGQAHRGRPMKELLQSLVLFVTYALWRLTRSKWLAIRLVDALGDETVNELAGMLLTKGLRRTDKRVAFLLHKRRQLPNLLIVLASTENYDYLPMIEPYVRDPDASVADAARIAIRILGP
jgi:hypothetical protein